MNNKQTTLANTNFRWAVRTFCNRALSFVWQCNWDSSRAAYPLDWPDIWNPVGKHRNLHLSFMDNTKFRCQVCLPACLFTCLSYCLIVLFTYLSYCLIYLFTYLSVPLFIYLPAYLYIYLSACLFIYLSVSLSFCLSVCLFVFFFVRNYIDGMM